MQCPNCQRENQPTSRFCIFCGALLPALEAKATPEPGQGPVSTPAEPPPALQEEVRRLGELVTLMNERLAALERRQGIPAPSPQATPTPEVAATPPTARVPRQEIATAPVDRVPPSEEKPAKASEREWEQILGGHWLARIGVIALVIGVGFFLKFAFDNNWIGTTGRVILGIVLGLALLGGGYYWQKRYPILAQTISGGGIAILYLSIWAAFAMYGLIDFLIAFAFLLLVSVASAALALRYNSIALAVIGILGAFIAPFILTVSGGTGTASPTTNADQDFWLFIGYIMAVDIGVLALSTFRNWRWFTLLGLLGSLAVFGLLHNDKVSLTASLVSLTLIFLIFVGATTLFHIVWRRPAQSFDQAVMVINAAAYFGISYALLWGDFRVWLGGFALLLAVFYGILAYVVLKRGAENVRLTLFALGIALVFLTVAIPVQLGNRAWTTVAWAAEGAVLIWLSFTLRMPRLRSYSYPVFAITAVRLLFFDQIVDWRTFRPVLNERFLAFTVSIAALYLSGYLLRQQRKTLRDWEEGAWSVYPIFFVAANFFTVWLLSAEVINYFDTSLALTALWTIYAVALLVVGMVWQWRPVRLYALALLVIPIGKVFVYDVFTLKQLYRIIAFVGLGILLLVSAYLYQRYSRRIRGFIAKK